MTWCNKKEVMGIHAQSIQGTVGFGFIRQEEPKLAPGDCETTHSHFLGFVYFFNYCFLSAQ